MSSVSGDSIKSCQKTIQNGCIKRLVKDVSDLYRNPLHDEGIYYIHDDEDMLFGYALIIGPKDSCYEHGYFMFKFQFPTNYPHSPPKVSFKTNSGKVRVHPNLYRSEKVCLSLLNTWQGEGWTSCQTIRSVLMVLLSILDDNPLLHEPGFSEKNKRHVPQINSYSKVIRYFSLNHLYFRISEPSYVLHKFDIFRDVIQETSQKRLLDVCRKVASIIKEPEFESKTLHKIDFYSFEYYIHYKGLKEILENRIEKYGMKKEYNEMLKEVNETLSKSDSCKSISIPESGS